MTDGACDVCHCAPQAYYEDPNGIGYWVAECECPGAVTGADQCEASELFFADRAAEAERLSEVTP